jgi:hypothetical protein
MKAKALDKCKELFPDFPAKQAFTLWFLMPILSKHYKLGVSDFLFPFAR